MNTLIQQLADLIKPTMTAQDAASDEAGELRELTPEELRATAGGPQVSNEP